MSSDGLFYTSSVAPTKTYSVFKYNIIDVVLFSHFNGRKRFSVIRHQPVVSSVSGLFSGCRPSAIVGGIFSRIVDSVDGCSVKITSDHVVEKESKVFPSFANKYSSCTVVFVVFAGLVIAPFIYSAPDRIQAVLAAISVFGLLLVFFAYKFRSDAPTRTRVAASEICCNANNKAAAVALTKPLLISLFLYNKPAKSNPGEVEFFTHDCHPSKPSEVSLEASGDGSRFRSVELASRTLSISKGDLL